MKTHGQPIRIVLGNLIEVMDKVNKKHHFDNQTDDERALTLEHLKEIHEITMSMIDKNKTDATERAMVDFIEGLR